MRNYRDNKDNNKKPRGFRDKDARFASNKKKPTGTSRFKNNKSWDFEPKKEFEAREDIIIGRNPVMEALKANRVIDKLFVSKGERTGSITQIVAIAKEKGIIIQEADKRKLDMLSQSENHQGVVAFASEQKYVEVNDIIAAAKSKGEQPFIIILDEINDPHNLGSIIRSADAAGVHGIIIPKRRSVGLSAVVSKVSAGAIEYVPVAKVTNLSQTIDELKKQGIWIVGTDTTGDKIYHQADFKGPVAMVIGSEGEGLGRLVKENCDYLISIPMKGQISSLNAGVAAGIIMFEVLRQRGQ